MNPRNRTAARSDERPRRRPTVRRRVLLASRASLTLPTATILLLAPWLVSLTLLSGPLATVTFVLLLAACIGLGSAFAAVGLSYLPPASRLLYAGPLGFVVLAAALQLTLHFHGPRVPILWLLTLVALAGLVGAARTLRRHRRRRIRGAAVLCALGFAVHGLFFLPSSLLNLAPGPDGETPFLYFSDFLLALVGVLKSDPVPVACPGVALAPLSSYHYGPYAVAAEISRFFHLPSFDAWFHVVRGAALVLVLVVAAAVGHAAHRCLGQRRVPPHLAMQLGVVGLFFAGSSTALFNGKILPHFPGASAATTNLLHYLTGFSLLWAHVGYLAVIGLLLLTFSHTAPAATRSWGLLLLPALLLPSNGWAALTCAGFVAAYLFLSRPSLATALLAALPPTLLAAAILGLGVAGGHISYFFDPLGSLSLYRLFAWTILGLGIRLYALTLIGRDWSPSGRPGALWMTLLVAGSTLSYLLVADNVAPSLGGETDQYLLILPQGVLGLFAFVLLTPTIHAFLRGARDAFGELAVDFLRLTTRVAGGFLLLALAYSIFDAVRGAETPHAVRVLVLSTALWLLAEGASRAARRWRRVHRLGGVAIAALLISSCLGWIPVFLSHGVQLLPDGVRSRITAGERQGLLALRAASDPGARFATNQHFIFISYPASYGYSAISERQAFLEGWQIRANRLDPIFESILSANDELFATADPRRALAILRRYEIDFIVCKPGSELRFPTAQPWLEPVEPAGDLAIYRVLRSG